MLICDGRTMTCLNKLIYVLAGVCEVYPCPWLLSYGYKSINEYTLQFFPKLQENVVCCVHVILCFVQQVTEGYSLGNGETSAM